jgi:hypothetical protein
MLIKSKARSGTTATIPANVGKESGNNADDGMDDLASRAKRVALAEAMRIIQSGGTQAEAVAAAREAARETIDQRMQASSPSMTATTTTTTTTAAAAAGGGGAKTDATAVVDPNEGGGAVDEPDGPSPDMDRIGLDISNRLTRQADDVAATDNTAAEPKVETTLGVNRGGLPPRGAQHAEGGGRGSIFSKLRSMGRNRKDKTDTTVAAALSAKMGRTAKKRRGRHALNIELGRSSHPPAVAAQQLAAPEPLAESRDDVQPPVADTDEAASSRDPHDGELKTKIAKDSSNPREDDREITMVEPSIKREVEIPKDPSIARDEVIPMAVSRLNGSESTASESLVSYDSYIPSYYMHGGYNSTFDSHDGFMDSIINAVNEALFPTKTKIEGQNEEKAVVARRRSDDVEEAEVKQTGCDILGCMELWCCSEELENPTITTSDGSEVESGLDADTANAVSSGFKVKFQPFKFKTKGKKDKKPDVLTTSPGPVSETDQRDSLVGPSNQLNDATVQDPGVPTTDTETPDSSFDKATSKRLIADRSTSKMNASSKLDACTVRSGAMETPSNSSSLVRSIGGRLLNGRRRCKKNSFSKTHDLCVKSGTIETISSKGTNSFLTSTVSDEPDRSKIGYVVKNTIEKGAVRCYFPPGGRMADVAVVEKVNESGILVQNDYSDNYNPNWRDNVADTVVTKAPSRTKKGVLEKEQQHQQQQYHHQHQIQQQPPQLPGQMYHQHQGVAPVQPSGFFPEGSLNMMQNNREAYGLSPVNNNYHSNGLPNVEQWQNPQYSQNSAMMRGEQQHIHSIIPVSREPSVKINANLSIESADERQDRYAGIEQHGVDRLDDRLVYTGRPYSSVGGMAMHQTAMGGYGSVNITYNNEMAGQMYHGMEGNRTMGGNAGEIVWNTNAGHQMMLAQQSSLHAPIVMSEDPNLASQYYGALHTQLQGMQIQQHHQLADSHPNAAVAYNYLNNNAKRQGMMAPLASFDLIMDGVSSPYNHVHK